MELKGSAGTKEKGGGEALLIEWHGMALDALANAAALVAGGGEIVFVNKGWKKFSEENAGRLADGGRGENYFEVCERATGEDAEMARAARDGIREVAKANLESFSLEYPCH